MHMDFTLMDFAPNECKILSPNSKTPLVTFGAMSYLVGGTLDAASMDCHILIGRYTALAHRLKFSIAGNHDYRCLTMFPEHMLTGDDAAELTNINPGSAVVNRNQLIIGSDVWVGSDALLLGGVRTGSGAVVGAVRDGRSGQMARQLSALRRFLRNIQGWVTAGLRFTDGVRALAGAARP